MLFLFTTFVSANGKVIGVKPDGEIRVQGDNMVWMAYRNGQWDIYHLNMKTNSQVNVTSNSNVQGYPDVWEQYIVWQEKSLEDFHIYLYDINTKAKEKISTVIGKHQEPRIADAKVVWVNENNKGKRVVMLYDLQDGRTKQISTDEAMAFGLEFDGNIATWMDHRNERFDIYMYDIAVGKEERITYGLEDEVDPLVSNGKVIWAVKYNNVKQVYMYDTNDGYTTRITVGKEDNTPLAFSGDSLLLIRGNELIFNNVNQITDLPIETPNRNLPKQAFLLGDKVLWFDGETFIIETIQDAIGRVGNIEEKVVPPAQRENRTNNTTVRENQNDFTLIKSQEDTVITTNDGILTLKIMKGTFDKDVRMVIQEENPHQIVGYQLLTPVYSWKVIENIKPNKPIQLIMNYELVKYQGNSEKILIYTQENNQIWPLTAKRDFKNNLLKTEVMANGNSLLSVYNRTFQDIKNHWAYEIVDVITAQHMIKGYPDGTFRPDQKMTRAEFVSTLVNGGKFDNKVEGNKSSSKNYFEDVAEGFWAAEAINIAYENGWVSGYDEKFKPNDLISREQMVMILMNLYKQNGKLEMDIVENGKSLNQYTDNQEINSWAKDAMSRAIEIGLIQGYNNKLTPLDNATRGEAATMIYKYLKITGEL